ncbi:MAG: enoyl-CoA hydratase [Proteobacteria bacterium]|nr:enoyl-CoA hydratase [Pseudomonadota bacterium]
MSQVVVSIEESVATIRLNDPGSLNALSASMGADFDAAMDGVSADESVRVLIITGTGRAFSAGGDVQAFYDNREDPTDVMRAILDGLHGSVSRILAAPFPTIAAINGVVAGAGMGVAMATDLAVAVDTAVFTMAYTGIGVSPDGSSTFFLPRLVGTRRAMEMILTNRRLSAAEALDLGIVNAVADGDTFDEEVANLALRLSRGPTIAYVRARELVRSSLASDPLSQMDAEAEAIMNAAKTDDFYEGVSAFIEKRPPTFTGT